MTMTESTNYAVVSNQTKNQETSSLNIAEFECLNSLKVEPDQFSISEFLKQSIKKYAKTTTLAHPITDTLNTYSSGSNYTIYTVDGIATNFTYFNSNHEQVSGSLENLSISLKNSIGKLCLDVAGISLPISDKLQSKINKITELETKYNQLNMKLHYYETTKSTSSQSNQQEELVKQGIELDSKIINLKNKIKKVKQSYEQEITTFNSLSEIAELQEKINDIIKVKILEQEKSKFKANEENTQILTENSKAEQSQIEVTEDTISKSRKIPDAQFELEIDKREKLNPLPLEIQPHSENTNNSSLQQSNEHKSLPIEQEEAEDKTVITQSIINTPTFVNKLKDYFWLLCLFLIAISIFIIKQFTFFINWIFTSLVFLKTFAINFIYGFGFFFGKTSFYFFLGNTLIPLMILCTIIYITNLYYLKKYISKVNLK